MFVYSSRFLGEEKRSFFAAKNEVIARAWRRRERCAFLAVGAGLEAAPDGRVLRRKTADDLDCVAMGPLFPHGMLRGFSVEIVTSRDGKRDGLTVGVTETVPIELRELPATADGLHRCWLVGFNGQAWDGGLGRWAAFPDANFAGLGVGEVVTVLVHRHHGSLEVLRNGVRVAILPGVLTDMPVFPVVDLLGAAQAVRVVPTPPLFHENLDSGTACVFPEVRTIRTDPEFPIATGELAWVADKE